MKLHLNGRQALFDTIGFWIPIGKLTSLDTKLFDNYAKEIGEKITFLNGAGAIGNA